MLTSDSESAVQGRQPVTQCRLTGGLPVCKLLYKRFHIHGLLYPIFLSGKLSFLEKICRYSIIGNQALYVISEIPQKSILKKSIMKTYTLHIFWKILTNIQIQYVLDLTCDSRDQIKRLGRLDLKTVLEGSILFHLSTDCLFLFHF